MTRRRRAVRSGGPLDVDTVAPRHGPGAAYLDAICIALGDRSFKILMARDMKSRAIFALGGLSAAVPGASHSASDPIDGSRPGVADTGDARNPLHGARQQCGLADLAGGPRPLIGNPSHRQRFRVERRARSSPIKSTRRALARRWLSSTIGDWRVDGAASGADGRIGILSRA